MPRRDHHSTAHAEREFLSFKKDLKIHTIKVGYETLIIYIGQKYYRIKNATKKFKRSNGMAADGIGWGKLSASDSDTDSNTISDSKRRFGLAFLE